MLFNVPREVRGDNEATPAWTSFHVAVVAQKAEIRSIRLRRLKP